MRTDSEKPVPSSLGIERNAALLRAWKRGYAQAVRDALAMLYERHAPDPICGTVARHAARLGPWAADDSRAIPPSFRG